MTTDKAKSAQGLPACEPITVLASAVEWLKKNYPTLCEKSGLCERIRGRLCTPTFPQATQATQTIASLRAELERIEARRVEAHNSYHNTLTRMDAEIDRLRAELERCKDSIASLMFDAFGEPRTRYVRVSLHGSHCVMHPSEGDTYLKDAKDAGDDGEYTVVDVYLSEREFEDLGHFPEVEPTDKDYLLIDACEWPSTLRASADQEAKG